MQDYQEINRPVRCHQGVEEQGLPNLREISFFTSLEVVVAARNTTIKRQARSAVDIRVESAGWAELQPSVPGAAMIQTQTLGAAHLVMLNLV